MAKDIEAPPVPHETMAALRSMGYKFYQAAADVVDNSIDAGATSIQVHVHADAEDPAASFVAIMDNGTGMSEQALIRAMTLGSSSASQGDLGKFGMGMKTASLSQCDRMVVATVTKQGFVAFSWDMEVLKKRGRWLLESVSTHELPKPAAEHLRSVKSGTVVVWSRLRKILGKSAHNATVMLERDMVEAMGYLKTVFHRHLRGEVPGVKVSMTMNNHPLEGWDPYCTSEKKAKLLKPVSFKVESAKGVLGSLTFKPVLLPSQDQFSSGPAFAAASGFKKWNDMQGFYVYRNNRLVDFGGWDMLRAKDEKTKFLRVAVEYTESPQMDEEMEINVSKQNASMPKSLRPEIDKILSEWTSLARANYSSARDHKQEFKEKKYSLVEIEKKLIRKCVGASEIALVKRLFRLVEKSL